MINIDRAAENEAKFWDKAAKGTKTGLCPYSGLISTADDKLYRITLFALDLIEKFDSKRILECGCGFGGVACFMAERGARVTAVDISERSLDVAKELALKKSLSDKISIIKADCSLLSFGENSFDYVIGSFILHHIQKPEEFIGRISRMLKPGGKAVFVENSSDNALLMFFRNLIVPILGNKKSSMYEYPLAKKEIEKFRKYFSEVNIHYPELVFLRLIASYFFNDHGIIRKILERADAFIYKHFKWFRNNSYFRVIELKKN